MNYQKTIDIIEDIFKKEIYFIFINIHINYPIKIYNLKK